MKRFYFSLFLFTMGSLFAQQSHQQFMDDMIEAEMKSAAKKLTNNKGVQQAINYDLKYHRLEWNINPEVNFISGVVTSYFQPTINNFSEVYFDLSNALSVDSVLYHGNSITFAQQTGDVLKITLPIVLSQGTLDSVSVFYRGVPINSTSLGGTFVQLSHANDSIIWTLSEPYGAMEWWPCKQDLNDKIDSVDIIVTTPKKYRVGSEGLLVNETLVGSNKIYHWKHRYPIPAYLISLAVTNYAVYSDYAPLSTGNLEILNYVYPEDSAQWATYTPDIIPILQFLDTLIGPYPFANEKYGHAQFGRGGGMEHQTMSSMNNSSFGLMAHELAHQWFGNKITCGSWQDIWLNEGFATYITGLIHKKLAPTWWYWWREATIQNVLTEPDGSVFCTDTTDISRIFKKRLSYSKGAYLLRMLEWKLGYDNFYQAIRNYLTDSNLVYSYAKTTDLKAHLEATSGLNLTEFFNDWYFGEGHPTYQIAWSQLGNNATFTINQTQSHSSVSFYEMPVPIYVKGQNQDTTLVFNHTFSNQQFTATLPFIIDSVFFDPEMWILAAPATILSINDLSTKNQKVSIYPNPGKDVLNIWTTNSSKINEVNIYNALGQKIAVETNQIAPNYLQINIQKYPSGNYFLEIKIDNTTIKKKWNKI